LLPNDLPRQQVDGPRPESAGPRFRKPFSQSRRSDALIDSLARMFEEHSELVVAIDAEHAQVCGAQRRLLALIAEVDLVEAWRDAGARDTAHWLAMRYGLSGWKAHRWIAAAHALEGLPKLCDALERGELGVDKIVELCRFATADSEAALITWAKEVSCGAIRHRGDLAARATVEEVADVERSRSVSWWYFDEGRRFGLEAELPAAPMPSWRCAPRGSREMPIPPARPW